MSYVLVFTHLKLYTEFKNIVVHISEQYLCFAVASRMTSFSISGVSGWQAQWVVPWDQFCHGPVRAAHVRPGWWHPVLQPLVPGEPGVWDNVQAR